MYLSNMNSIGLFSALIGGHFSGGGDLLPEELNKAGASIKIKHNTIRGPIKGRSQENKGLWNQDKKSWD